MKLPDDLYKEWRDIQLKYTSTIVHEVSEISPLIELRSELAAVYHKICTHYNNDVPDKYCFNYATMIQHLNFMNSSIRQHKETEILKNQFNEMLDYIDHKNEEIETLAAQVQNLSLQKVVQQSNNILPSQTSSQTVPKQFLSNSTVCNSISLPSLPPLPISSTVATPSIPSTVATPSIPSILSTLSTPSTSSSPSIPPIPSISSMFSTSSSSSSSSLDSSNFPKTVNIKHIQSFNGDVLDFPTFESVFFDMIVINPNIDLVTKRSFFLTCTTGVARNQAQDAIRKFPLDMINAWATFKQQFVNPKDIQASIQQTLQTIPTAKNELDLSTITKIKILAKDINQMIFFQAFFVGRNVVVKLNFCLLPPTGSLSLCNRQVQTLLLNFPSYDC